MIKSHCQGLPHSPDPAGCHGNHSPSCTDAHTLFKLKTKADMTNVFDEKLILEAAERGDEEDGRS